MLINRHLSAQLADLILEASKSFGMNKFFQMEKSLGGTGSLGSSSTAKLKVLGKTIRNLIPRACLHFTSKCLPDFLHQVKHGWLLSGQGEPLYGLPSDPCLFQCGSAPPLKEGHPMVWLADHGTCHVAIEMPLRIPASCERRGRRLSQGLKLQRNSMKSPPFDSK